MTCTSIKHFLFLLEKEGCETIPTHQITRTPKAKLQSKQYSIVCLKITLEISHRISDVPEYLDCSAISLSCFAQNDTTIFHCQASHLCFGQFNTVAVKIYHESMICCLIHRRQREGGEETLTAVHTSQLKISYQGRMPSK